jgi:hypothetical protein
MPRYFFDVTDTGETLRDSEVMELASLERPAAKLSRR